MICKEVYIHLVLFYIEMEITWPIFGIFEISFKSAYSPIIILLNLFNYICGQFMSETIYSKRFDYCNRNYHFKGGGVSTFISS